MRKAEDYISGQELCRELGVSRTAVWKAVNQLKEEGYVIEAVQNRGYRILGSPDVISAEEVKSRLDTVWAGCQVKYFETLDSTNIAAKRMAEEGAQNGTLVIADQQTAGRGRRGRQWETPKGETIAMTLLMRPRLRPEKASMMTLVMGMAVSCALQELFGLECQIKWPNDIVYQGKKLCGILTEMSAEINEIHYLVIGCGINANNKEFPGELANKADSLCRILGSEVNRAEIVSACMKYVEYYYDIFQRTEDMSALAQEYNHMLASVGQEVCVMEPGHEYRGISLGIDESGQLLVKKEDGSIACVYAGEVSVRGIYGYA